ncbi:uncharacterized protein BKA78DRAFT_6577 [Phyllosticta capitalensis]|uniref:Transmembrane protein n=1 Tax=Phyllosticta capitalensis TaxID=121624 RepID=A0ABR1Z2I1_9PEZI
MGREGRTGVFVDNFFCVFLSFICYFGYGVTSVYTMRIFKGFLFIYCCTFFFTLSLMFRFVSFLFRPGSFIDLAAGAQGGGALRRFGIEAIPDKTCHSTLLESRS